MIMMIRTERRLPDGTITPPLPEDVAWYARVNAGARFRLEPDDQLLGGNGEPYLRLPLANDDEVGYPFRELALYLYSRSIGALLCHGDKAVGPGTDHFPLSYGDIVDYIQTGELCDRIPVTPPWGYPEGFVRDSSDDALPDFSRMPEIMHAPDDFVLPKRIRFNMAWLFHQVEAEEVGVSLMRSDNGTQMLFIQYRLPEALRGDTGLHQHIGQRLMWYLPRQYAALAMPTLVVKGHALLSPP